MNDAVANLNFQDMENEPSSIFDEEFLTETTVRRRELLPKALKRYVWWFLAICAFASLQTLKRLFRVVGDPDMNIEAIGQAVILVFLLLRILSCLLILREKKTAILFALIVSGIAMLLGCLNIAYLLLGPDTNPAGRSTIMLVLVSLALEVPYAIMLWKVRTKWEAIDTSQR